MIQEAGTYVHRMILDSFAMVEDLEWPPSAQYLENMTDIIPSQLEQFFSSVISDKPTPQTNKAH